MRKMARITAADKGAKKSGLGRVGRIRIPDSSATTGERLQVACRSR